MRDYLAHIYEVECVLKSIQNSLKNDMSFCIIPLISDEYKELLINLGFKVEEQRDQTSRYNIIRWDDEKLGFEKITIMMLK